MIRSAFLTLTLLLGVSLMANSAKAADAENTLYMDLKDGRVVIEMRPDLAPKHVKRIKELLQRGADPRAQDRWSGDTALHLLCGRESLKCPPEELEQLIRLFISRGVNPDEQDRDNNTPLHPAAYADNVVAARALLAAGANPSKWDSDYQTPRDRAEYFNHTAVATLLREAEEKRRTAT